MTLYGKSVFRKSNFMLSGRFCKNHISWIPKVGKPWSQHDSPFGIQPNASNGQPGGWSRFSVDTSMHLYFSKSFLTLPRCIQGVCTGSTYPQENPPWRIQGVCTGSTYQEITHHKSCPSSPPTALAILAQCSNWGLS
jgi:hypothetical protein